MTAPGPATVPVATDRAGSVGGTASPDGIADQLRRDIRQARLEPDARLREVDVAARYGVSRARAREALRVLHAERIVDLRPGQGARVAKVSIFQLYDLIDMRAALFALVARQAAQRAGDGHLEELVAALDAMLLRDADDAARAEPTAMIDAIAAASRNWRARGLLGQLASRTVWRYAVPGIEADPGARAVLSGLWRQLRVALGRRQGARAGQLADTIIRTERRGIMERLLVCGGDQDG